MKGKTLNRTNGITLVALVVTIVVLLILAGITLIYVFGDNGIIKLAQDAKNKTEEEIRNEQGDFANLEDYIGNVYGWTQDKTVVKRGTITLEVGQEVKGYTANGVGNGNWYVLGAKDGKLLITTNSNQGIVELSGKDGYAKGVSKLNTEGAKFKDNNMAELARSINVEDINRVTGYKPDEAKYNEGTNHPCQWDNKVTYTLNADGKIHYQGTKYPKEDIPSIYQEFEYWNGSNWISLARGENKTITYDFYYYYPQTLSTDDSKTSETTINGSSKAYTLLFANTSNEETSYYWLGSQCFFARDDGGCTYVMRHVRNGSVDGRNLYNSAGITSSFSSGLRPVVSLKSNVKVTSDGTLSI